MTHDDRASDIRALLWEHAHPTLRNMDRDRIAKLTEQILKIATDTGLWTRWSQDREEIAERAANLWIPIDDLRTALNATPREASRQGVFATLPTTVRASYAVGETNPVPIA